MTFRYVNITGTHTFNIDLGTQAVRLGSINSGLVENAELGTVGSGGIEIDDPTGALEILPLQYFKVTESLASDAVVYFGVIGDIEVTRGDTSRSSLITEAARVWSLDLNDFNTLLSMRILRSFNRPAETASARLTALLALSYCPVEDLGKVTYPTHKMDKNSYTGQTFADVIDDCGAAVAYNYWAYWSESDAAVGLAFLNPAGITDTSVASISNVLSDIGGDCYYPLPGNSLRILGSRIASGVFETYGTAGHVYVTRSATSDLFLNRDMAVSLSNVKTAAKAKAVANKALTEAGGPDNRIPVSIRVPAAKVNDIRVGQRLLYRSSYQPGYNPAVYCLVMNRAVLQDEESEDFYTLKMELTPQDDTNNISGNAFAAILKSDEGSGSAIVYTNTGDTAPGGWYAEPTVGPLAVVESGNPYHSIRASQDMIVRIQCSASFAAVTGPITIHLDVTVDGTTVGSDSAPNPNPGGFWSGSLNVDVHNVSVSAGSIITYTATPFPWGSLGNNLEFLRVGRGTFVWDSGAVTWVGP
jgi:hypothetical protein